MGRGFERTEKPENVKPKEGAEKKGLMSKLKEKLSPKKNMEGKKLDGGKSKLENKLDKNAAPKNVEKPKKQMSEFEKRIKVDPSKLKENNKRPAGGDIKSPREKFDDRAKSFEKPKSRAARSFDDDGR